MSLAACENCRHNNVCRYIEIYKEYQKKWEEATPPFPVSITLHCDFYSKIPERPAEDFSRQFNVSCAKEYIQNEI